MRAVVAGAYNRLMMSSYFSNPGFFKKRVYGQILELLLGSVNEAISYSYDRL